MITFLQILIFIIYVIFIYKKFGVLSSISASTYELKGQNRWWFLAFLWGIGILNLFQGLQGWGFLASAGFIFAGITIDHAEAPAKIPHKVGTFLAIAASFIGLYVVHGLYWPALAFVGFLLCSTQLKNKIWWIEIFAMIFVAIGYILK